MWKLNPFEQEGKKFADQKKQINLTFSLKNLGKFSLFFSLKTILPFFFLFPPNGD